MSNGRIKLFYRDFIDYQLPRFNYRSPIAVFSCIRYSSSTRSLDRARKTKKLTALYDLRHRLPNLDGLIATPTNQNLPLRTKGNRLNRSKMTGKGTQAFSGLPVPQLDELATATSQSLTIRVKGDGGGSTGLSQKTSHLFARSRIP